MKVAVFSSKAYDEVSLKAANGAENGGPHDLHFFEARLNEESAALARGFEAVCCFVNDLLNRQTLAILATGGTRLVALRSAGFNHADLTAAGEFGIRVVRVPAYSPYAVAEHTVGLMLALNRKLHRAYNRVREGNFALEGLLGFDMRGSTVGIIGTGRIGAVTAHTLSGFGVTLLGYDVAENPDCLVLGMQYLSLPEIFSRADIVTLHCPLTPQTHHLINARALMQMKRGVMLINTSRGGLLDTAAVVEALKSGKIGALGLDVYEQEEALFFEDLSNEIIQDDVFQRLLTFPNVIITGHQAFFTREAVANIAGTTVRNISAYGKGEGLANEVVAKREGRR